MRILLVNVIHNPHPEKYTVAQLHKVKQMFTITVSTKLFTMFPTFCFFQGVIKVNCISWLTNSALVWAQMRREKGRGAEGFRGLSQWVQLLYQGAQINFGNLTSYLTYDFFSCFSTCVGPGSHGRGFSAGGRPGIQVHSFNTVRTLLF